MKETRSAFDANNGMELAAMAPRKPPSWTDPSRLGKKRPKLKPQPTDLLGRVLAWLGLL